MKDNLLISLIILVIVICMIISIKIENLEPFITRSELVSKLDELDQSKDGLLDSLKPRERTLEFNESAFANEAQSIINNLKKKYNNITNINIETDYTNYGHKCLDNKKCEDTNKGFGCEVKLKNNREQFQKCDNILKNTATQKKLTNINNIAAKYKNELKKILAQINLVKSGKEGNIDLLIKDYSEKKNTIKQQTYFDNNFDSILELHNDKTDNLEENVNEKQQLHFNERELYSSLENKNKETESLNNKYIRLLRFLLVIYIIIMFLKSLKMELN